MSPEHCLKMEKVAGSATCKQSKTVLSFKVSLFIQSRKRRVCVFYLLRPKTSLFCLKGAFFNESLFVLFSLLVQNIKLLLIKIHSFGF